MIDLWSRLSWIQEVVTADLRNLFTIISQERPSWKPKFIKFEKYRYVTFCFVELSFYIFAKHLFFDFSISLIKIL